MNAPVQLELPLNIHSHIEQIEEAISKVVEATAETFPTKAAQGRAQELVSKARDSVCILAHKVLLLAPRDNRSAQWNDQYYSFPSAHQWKPAKHHKLFADMQIIIPYMDQLSELREAIKTTPIVPVAPKVSPEVKAKLDQVHKSIMDIMEARKASYARALELGELFNGLPVSANVHVCYMNNGTHYLRCFYYLDGELTAANVLIAAAEELQRRREEAEG